MDEKEDKRSGRLVCLPIREGQFGAEDAIGIVEGLIQSYWTHGGTGPYRVCLMYGADEKTRVSENLTFRCSILCTAGDRADQIRQAVARITSRFAGDGRPASPLRK